MTKMTTSAVVSFGSADDASEVLAAEVDSREINGFNLGKSSFSGGDEPVFLVTASVPYSWQVSKGTGSVISTREILEHETDVIVALQPGENTHEVSFDKPAVEGGVAVEYEFGTAMMSSGKLLADGRLGSVILTLPALPEWDKRVRWLVARLRWKSSAIAIRVTPPAAWKTALPENARIVLMITGE